MPKKYHITGTDTYGDLLTFSTDDESRATAMLHQMREDLENVSMSEGDDMVIVPVLEMNPRGEA